MNRRRLALAVLSVLVVFGMLSVGATVAGFGPLGGPSGQLEPVWTSDTARDTRINHHPIGATPDGDLVLAPVAVPASAGDGAGATTSTTTPHAHDHTHVSTDAGVQTTGRAACQLVSLTRTGHVEWAYAVPAANCSAHAVTQPGIGDLDGDGKREIAVGTTEKAVVVLAANGSEQYRVPLEAYGYGRPTIADVTDAPGNELVASDIRGSVVVSESDTVAWRASLNGTAYPSPVVRDLDGDGAVEVLVATGERVVAFERTGDPAWTREVPGWTLATADIDDDAAVETVATGPTEIVALDGVEGETQWRRTFDGTPNTRVAVDGDGDGAVELYVSLNGGRLLALDAESGETEWESSVPSGGERLTPAPVVGDLTGDGTLEVVAVTNSGGVAVVDAESGTRRATYAADESIWTQPTLTDLDRDGDSELLLRLGDGRVQALDYEE